MPQAEFIFFFQQKDGLGIANRREVGQLDRRKLGKS